jgi:hypothetical protein
MLRIGSTTPIAADYNLPAIPNGLQHITGGSHKVSHQGIQFGKKAQMFI